MACETNNKRLCMVAALIDRLSFSAPQPTMSLPHHRCLIVDAVQGRTSDTIFELPPDMRYSLARTTSSV